MHKKVDNTCIWERNELLP